MKISKGALSGLTTIAANNDYGVLFERNGRAISTDGVALIRLWLENDTEDLAHSVVVKDTKHLKGVLKGMKKRDTVSIDSWTEGADPSDRDTYPNYKILDEASHEITTKVDLARLKQLVTAMVDASENDSVSLTFMGNGAIRLQTEDEVTCYLMSQA